ncbi:hypothetical protein U8607_08575 [Methylobacterium durans]|uniref:hypothetical protein n=1 Tax=Methylobacterium durans TaxID=2202825 RepID=UPI002AFEB34B|nr:hypothetical protein [Methylobacterium durans]MEA1832137.1 hypothetical protein [Methylobacterium durans]
MQSDGKPARDPRVERQKARPPQDGEPGPHSPPPKGGPSRDGRPSGGYESGQRDDAPANRKGGYGAG